MTRKQLARDSGVSERYLAQIESGHGNISVLVLRQLAKALNVSVDVLLFEDPEPPVELVHTVEFLRRLCPEDLKLAHQLLLDQFGGVDPAARHRRIALVGLRGAGKSTLVAALAERLEMPFLELDRLIEQKGGLTLDLIFDFLGQQSRVMDGIFLGAALVESIFLGYLGLRLSNRVAGPVYRVTQDMLAFAKGEPAKEMFCTVTGRYRLIELGMELKSGQVVGELAMVAPDNRRTATLECIEEGEALSITYEQVEQLYYQNPTFGFYFLRLATARLFDNVGRMETELARQQTAQASRA